MTPARAPWIVAVIAALVAAAFALLFRLPLPFDGFAVTVAAVLAFLLTVAGGLLLPARALWSDAERLRHAFGQRHGMSGERAGNALAAISTAHDRATVLRASAQGFVPELKARTEAAADLLDGAARDVFYDPGTLSAHRANLVRSELVEEAVRAHAKLRSRDGADAQVKLSREHLTTALDALESAFGAAGDRLADRLVLEVDVASSTAEAVLGRGRKSASE